MRTKAVAVKIQAVFAPFNPSLAKVVDGSNTASAAIFQIGLLIALPCFFLDAQKYAQNDLTTVQTTRLKQRLISLGDIMYRLVPE
tara:strand:+ start:593 stop:847 length:255 start_codon:yes stop_codon:yes gene_type:complete